MCVAARHSLENVQNLNIYLYIYIFRPAFFFFSKKCIYSKCHAQKTCKSEQNWNATGRRVAAAAERQFIDRSFLLLFKESKREIESVFNTRTRAYTHRRPVIVPVMTSHLTIFVSTVSSVLVSIFLWQAIYDLFVNTRVIILFSRSLSISLLHKLHTFFSFFLKQRILIISLCLSLSLYNLCNIYIILRFL